MINFIWSVTDEVLRGEYPDIVSNHEMLGEVDG